MSLSSSAAAAASTATNPMLAAHNNLNRKWVLKRRPVGLFDPELDAELLTSCNDETAPLSETESKLEDHQVVVEPQLLSVDAFLRTMMDEGALPFHGSLPLGAPIPALGYGRVVWAGPKSGHSVGKMVTGMLTASDRSIVSGKTLVRSFKPPFLERSTSLGLLGKLSGLTAYAGVYYVCKAPRRGETVVVTGAAGSVGSIVVQLCRSTGARVVGVAGGELKTQYLRDTLGCDAVVDYKHKTRTLEEQIESACPDGIDFCFDNVGGETLDELLDKINTGARIVICGAISQYSGNLNSKTQTVEGPSNYLKLAEKNAQMKGFTIIRYLAKLPLMMVGMLWLYARGKVRVTEHIEVGLETFPYALHKLFTGETIGKTLVRIKSDDDDDSK